MGTDRQRCEIGAGSQVAREPRLRRRARAGKPHLEAIELLSVDRGPIGVIGRDRMQRRRQRETGSRADRRAVGRCGIHFVRDRPCRLQSRRVMHRRLDDLAVERQARRRRTPRRRRRASGQRGRAAVGDGEEPAADAVGLRRCPPSRSTRWCARRWRASWCRIPQTPSACVDARIRRSRETAPSDRTRLAQPPGDVDGHAVDRAPTRSPSGGSASAGAARQHPAEVGVVAAADTFALRRRVDRAERRVSPRCCAHVIVFVPSSTLWPSTSSAIACSVNVPLPWFGRKLVSSM